MTEGDFSAMSQLKKSVACIVYSKSYLTYFTIYGKKWKFVPNKFRNTSVIIMLPSNCSIKPNWFLILRFLSRLSGE